MRTMLLSFKSDVFKRVQSGEKIYEHRKVFPDEPIKAYLYISSPIKAISGIMILSNRIHLKSWRDKYAYDKEAVKRIDSYLQYHKFAMQIDEFQNTNQISLNKLRTDIQGFVVPQMYYFIDDTALLKYLENNLYPVGEKISHSFAMIESSEICVY